jgi:hypothetical protein
MSVEEYKWCTHQFQSDHCLVIVQAFWLPSLSLNIPYSRLFCITGTILLDYFPLLTVLPHCQLCLFIRAASSSASVHTSGAYWCSCFDLYKSVAQVQVPFSFSCLCHQQYCNENINLSFLLHKTELKFFQIKNEPLDDCKCLYVCFRVICRSANTCAWRYLCTCFSICTCSSTTLIGQLVLLLETWSFTPFFYISFCLLVSTSEKYEVATHIGFDRVCRGRGRSGFEPGTDVLLFHYYWATLSASM